MKWLKIHPIPKDEIMESSIKELLHEFDEEWRDFYFTAERVKNFLMRAYEIGKMVQLAYLMPISKRKKEAIK